MKYTLRKLGLLIIVMALAAAPFAWKSYQKANPSDPYIIMARKVAAFDPGEIDVVSVFPGISDLDRLIVVVNIAKYASDWPDRHKENFERHVVGVARENGSASLEILIGWDYPSRAMRVQGIVTCDTLRAIDCRWDSVAPGVMLRPQFVKWPGMGQP